MARPKLPDPEMPAPTGALVAAGTRLRFGPGRSVEADAPKTRPWQDDAWQYYDAVPEVKFAVLFVSNMLSKVRFFAAALDGSGQPIPVDSEQSSLNGSGIAQQAMVEMARLRSSFGGQGEINRVATSNLEVVGEFYLWGRGARTETSADGAVQIPESWDVLSRDEIEFKKEVDDQGRPTIFIKTDPEDKTPIKFDHENDALIRGHMRHPRYRRLADTNMRALVVDCETLTVLNAQVKAEARSRMSAPIFCVPKEITFQTTPGEAPNDGGASKFIEDLVTALTTPIEDPESVASVAPMVMRAESQYLRPDVLRTISLARETAAETDARIDQRVNRLARGLNVPVEVVMGHMSTTFANAEQVDQDVFDDHGEPRCRVLADIYTSSFLRPQLIEAGFSAAEVENVFVWYDPSDAIRVPQPDDTPEEALDRAAISFAAYRRMRGIPEDAAPDDAERALSIAIKSGALGQAATVALLKLGGLNLPDDLADPANDPAQQPQQDAVAAALLTLFSALRPVQSSLSHPILAAVEGAQQVTPFPETPDGFGRVLVEIDRSLRERLIGAALTAMERALERAGNRARGRAQRRKGVEEVIASVSAPNVCATLGPGLVAALGYEESDLLDGAWDVFGVQFREWCVEAWEATLDVLDQFEPVDAVERDAVMYEAERDIAEAWQWLVVQLNDQARALIWDPHGDVEVQAFGRVPAGMIRTALEIAGGADAVMATVAAAAPVGATVPTTPRGGIATGSRATGSLKARGGGVLAYRWVYGPAVRTPFEPHRNLNGVVFERFTDERLVSHTPWLPTSHYYPGDHRGCVCDAEPIVARRARGLSAEGSEQLVPEVKPPPPEPMGEVTIAPWDSLPESQRAAIGEYLKSKHKLGVGLSADEISRWVKERLAKNDTELSEIIIGQVADRFLRAYDLSTHLRMTRVDGTDISAFDAGTLWYSRQRRRINRIATVAYGDNPLGEEAAVGVVAAYGSNRNWIDVYKGRKVEPNLIAAVRTIHVLKDNPLIDFEPADVEHWVTAQRLPMDAKEAGDWLRRANAAARYETVNGKRVQVEGMRLSDLPSDMAARWISGHGGISGRGAGMLMVQDVVRAVQIHRWAMNEPGGAPPEQALGGSKIRNYFNAFLSWGRSPNSVIDRWMARVAFDEPGKIAEQWKEAPDASTQIAQQRGWNAAGGGKKGPGSYPLIDEAMIRAAKARGVNIHDFQARVWYVSMIQERNTIPEPEKLVKAIASAARTHKFGFTVDPINGKVHEHGYAIARLGESLFLPEDAFKSANRAATAKKIAEWIAEHADEFAEDTDLNIGGWLRTPRKDDPPGTPTQWVIDPSYVRAKSRTSLLQAKAEGRALDQEAIFDLDEGVEIDTGGSGGIQGGRSPVATLRQYERLSLKERHETFNALPKAERDRLGDPVTTVPERIAVLLGDKPLATQGSPTAAITGRVKGYSKLMSQSTRSMVQRSALDFDAALAESNVPPETRLHLGQLYVEHLVALESEGQRRTLGDHGARHLLGDARMALEMLERNPHVKMTPALRAEVMLTSVLHDVGYLTPPSRMFMDDDHPRWSQMYFDGVLKERLAPVLGHDVVERMSLNILRHQYVEVDWRADPIGSAIRTADNLALFSTEKTPPLIREVPGAYTVLAKFSKGSITAEEAARQLRVNIASSSLSQNMKDSLTEATYELSDYFVKASTGMKAGAIKGFEWSTADDTMHVKVARTQAADLLQSVFGTGERQFKKMAETYGVEVEDLWKRKTLRIDHSLTIELTDGPTTGGDDGKVYAPRGAYLATAPTPTERVAAMRTTGAKVAQGVTPGEPEVNRARAAADAAADAVRNAALEMKADFVSSDLSWSDWLDEQARRDPKFARLVQAKKDAQAAYVASLSEMEAAAGGRYETGLKAALAERGVRFNNNPQNEVLLNVVGAGGEDPVDVWEAKARGLVREALASIPEHWAKKLGKVYVQLHADRLYRANYDPAMGIVHVGLNALDRGTADFVHELLHAVEQKDPYLSSATLERLTTKGSLDTAQQIPGGYGKDEIGVGGFADPYTGKVYPARRDTGFRPTEVLSTIGERTLSSEIRLNETLDLVAPEDREWFIGLILSSLEEG